MDGLWVWLTTHGNWTNGRTFNEALKAALASAIGADASQPVEVLWLLFGLNAGYPTTDINVIQRIWMASVTGLPLGTPIDTLRDNMRYVP